MASIEERAEKFADAMVKGALGTRNDYYDSYIKGAIDQRKIDIEKACKWLSTLPEQLDVYEDSHYVINRDTLIEQFKQTMEE